MRIDPIVLGTESTVVAQYEAEPVTADGYQSEAELEESFIAQLQAQAYEYLPIDDEKALIANLRTQLERLNSYVFTDHEWEVFFHKELCPAKDTIVDKARRLHEENILLLRRDDGTTKNIRLLDMSTIHNNRLQVINQYTVPDSATRHGHANRYDVTILVNGLPMVHVELKRRGVDIREAFNQITRYQRDSFWSGSGLFEYVQVFVISNGTLTKYYSNTTRNQHIAESTGKRKSPRTRQSSNSFEFTSWWADFENHPIHDLPGFTRTFFAKHTILAILTRYCVLTADNTLLVMRPYQIAATERILRRILTSTNAHRLGTLDAGGYVWHTTGSGKTLTSFKTAQLATAMDGVDKVLFVVDRKDLDHQTVKEYDRFQKGAANSNTSTAVLKRQLEDPSAKIIITTIQKLSTFIKANAGHSIYDGHIVIIFDECHRSQFGDMHTAITKAFRKYHLFGFTGTPIFSTNSGSTGSPQLRTTAQAFGDQLHSYTIDDAIRDQNVLPFRVDYLSTIRTDPSTSNTQVLGINTESALLANDRIDEIVHYTLDHFNQKTKRNAAYTLKDRRVHGFNSIFATASIEAAKIYYNRFKLAMEKAGSPKLRIALLYSYAPNQEEPDGILGEEAFDTDALSSSDRDFLEDAIQDYNEIFGTSFDTSSHGFEGYYQDVARRLRNRELDMVIVVNMLLTGFDATAVNTLWVDKSLRAHGLIQAFSRTNRILNSVKTFGNIVCFRDLRKETDDAIALFGDKQASGIVLLKPYAEYLSEYASAVNELREHFPPGQQPVSEQDQKDFIKLFGAILRLTNILTSFDEFTDDRLLGEREMQDYQSLYLELHAQFKRAEAADKEAINEDVVFEIELIKQVEVNVDYILMLVEHHREQYGDDDTRKLLTEINRAVAASPTLRGKRDLIEEFVESVSGSTDMDARWKAFIDAKREAELKAIITEQRLRPDETHAFMQEAFNRGELPITGTAITRILPRMSRFSRGDSRTDYDYVKKAATEALSRHLERFSGLG